LQDRRGPCPCWTWRRGAKPSVERITLRGSQCDLQSTASGLDSIQIRVVCSVYARCWGQCNRIGGQAGQRRVLSAAGANAISVSQGRVSCRRCWTGFRRRARRGIRTRKRSKIKEGHKLAAGGDFSAAGLCQVLPRRRQGTGLPPLSRETKEPKRTGGHIEQFPHHLPASRSLDPCSGPASGGGHGGQGGKERRGHATTS